MLHPTPQIKFSHDIIFPMGYMYFLNTIRIWPIPIEHFYIPMGLLIFHGNINIPWDLKKNSHGKFHIPIGFLNFPWEIKNPMGI